MAGGHDKAAEAPDGAERLMEIMGIMEKEESYENMVIRERFEKLRRMMKQDYRDVFKARCMALEKVCESMVSLLEFEKDRHEWWPTLHALIECATTFVETDIPLFEVRSREDLQAGAACQTIGKAGALPLK